MTTTANDLLDLPAAQAGAAIAAGYLDDAAAAAARLHDRSDDEALHDFRVAIRRLRVTLRGYPFIEARLSHKQRRRLRTLARRTNPARAAEVQLAWCRVRSSRCSREQRATLERLRGRLRERHRRLLAGTENELVARFAKLERKLRRRLIAKPADDRSVAFRSLAAAALVRHATALRSNLDRTLLEAGPVDLHTTRIAAKRLRYLLEPLAPGLGHAEIVVDRLKELQDLLGVLTDGHELAAALRAEENAGEGATVALRLLHSEARRVVRKLQRALEQRPDLKQQMDRLVQQLRPVPAPSPPSMRQPSRRRRATV